jgi:hypothetical protein
MKQEELAHILRAAARIADDNEILVIGSQAILGSYAEEDLPQAAYGSIEADVAFFDDPDDRKSDMVDGAIGEGSSFHDRFGIYGQGVNVKTAVLPAGWRDRLVPYDRDDALPSEAKCLDAHDLVVSKLVAGREKDREFAEALVVAGLILVDTLLKRAAVLESVEAVRHRVAVAIEGIDARIKRKSG